MFSRCVFSAALAASVLFAADDVQYRQPPEQIKQALNARPFPSVSVSPHGDFAVFLEDVRYPAIADVAQPMARLAGIRIDTNTNGMHRALTYVSYSVRRLADGAEVKLNVPSGGKLGAPIWSPDGKQFAFTNTTTRGIELWLASPAAGTARRLHGAEINAVVIGGAFGPRAQALAPVLWLGDNRTLLVRLVPAGRGAVPAAPAIPTGPHVQESLGHAGPAPTFEDLLATPHDEDLFDYYATVQLAYIDSATGAVTPLGRPGIYTTIRFSPDARHVLVSRIHKPYSYQLPALLFPQGGLGPFGQGRV